MSRAFIWHRVNTDWFGVEKTDEALERSYRIARRVLGSTKTAIIDNARERFVEYFADLIDRQRQSKSVVTFDGDIAKLDGQPIKPLIQRCVAKRLIKFQRPDRDPQTMHRQGLWKDRYGEYWIDDQPTKLIIAEGIAQHKVTTGQQP